MELNHHFNLTIKNKNYQFDLILNGNNLSSGYKVKAANQKDKSIIQQLLKSVEDKKSSSIEELADRLQQLPSVSKVKITQLFSKSLLKSQRTALEKKPEPITSNQQRIKQVNLKERKKAVETLTPQLSAPGVEIKPVDISERMKDLGVPGVGIAIINDGKVEWSKGYGELSNTHVLSQGASTSKAVTALTILSLIDQRQKFKHTDTGQSLEISLDTDVRTILGEKLWQSIDPNGITKEKGKQVTIRYLLSHTAGTTVSGFRGYPRLQALEKEIQDVEKQLQEMKSGKKDTKQDQLLQKKLKKEGKLTTDDIIGGKGNSNPVKIAKPPGSEFSYSGGGTTLLQKIIEVITEKPFVEVVQNQVLNPLGMKSATYSPEKQPIIHGNDHLCKPLLGRYHYYPELAAAGLWTTPSELAQVAIGIQQSLSGKKGSLLSKQLAEEMLTSQTKDKPNALGVFVEKEKGSTTFFHEGSNMGYRCMFIGNDNGQGAVVMTNSEFGDSLMQELIPNIAKVYNWPGKISLKKMFPPSLSSKERLSAKEQSKIDPKEWVKDFSGDYFFENHKVQVFEKGGKVFVHVDTDDPFEIRPLSKNIACYQRYNPGPWKEVEFKIATDKSIILNLFGTDHKRRV